MKKKFLILSLIIALITSVLSISVYATEDSEYGFTTTMTATNTTVAPGGEVLLTVNISNISAESFGDVGINKFSARIEYDKDVFELLNESSFEGIDGWIASYNAGTEKVVLTRTSFLKTSGGVMQISLKTKSTAGGAQGAVTLRDIMGENSSDQSRLVNPVTSTINVRDTGSGSNNGNTGNSGNIAPLNLTFPTSNNATQNPSPVNNSLPIVPSTNNTSNTVSNNAVNNTVNNTSNRIQVVNESDGDIPFTGTDSNALARIIIGVIFISLVIYIKIERMNKDIR